MKDIHIFFNDLRLNSGAIWLEGDKINFSAPEKFQNQKTDEFIVNNKSVISSILSENSIFSEATFLNTSILRDNVTIRYPLSPAQERLWFIEKYEAGTNAYHIPKVLELDPDTKVEGIKYAFEKIVSRHEILRTTIEETDNGEGFQVVNEKPVPFEEIVLTDKDDFEALIKEEIDRPFDLGDEYPIRVKLYKIEANKRIKSSLKGRIILLVNVHHIASDGWSIEIFHRELLVYYESYLREDLTFELPKLEIQYKDYAIWQQSYLQGDILSDQLSYWRDRLLGYETLNIPVDYDRPNRIDYRGASKVFSIDADVSNKLRSLAKGYGVTLHSVMLSSINILLNKYTGQEDIVIGSPIANRHHQQTKDLIGFFTNIKVNRTFLNSSQTYEELILKVHQDEVAAQLHQDLPFEKLVEELDVERDPSRHPIFQVILVQNFNVNDRTNEKNIGYFKDFQGSIVYETTKFDLEFYINDSGGELISHINYATSLFNKDTIERLIDNYKYLLSQLVESPLQPYSKSSLLRPSEYDRVVHEWNETEADYPADKTIHELFEEQVEKTPDHIALVYEGEELSYRELNEKSNQLARHIRMKYKEQTGEELKSDTLIGLYLDRSLEMVIGTLAVLKAGGAYVPLSPDYPEERVKYMLEDSSSKLLITEEDYVERLQGWLGGSVTLLLPGDVSTDMASDNLEVYSGPEDLAYVIYTSGTTGKPKGVMIEHRSALNTICSLQSVYSVNNKYFKSSHFSDFVFDVSVSELFNSICFGGSLHILSTDLKLNPNLLADYIAKHLLEILFVPPGVLALLPKKTFPSLHTIIFAGEPCDQHNCLYWAENYSLFNYYGPTEAAIYASGKQAEVRNLNEIGKPISNAKLYVLDTGGQPVPVGAPGELHIGGAGLARGYLNNAELTSERFIANPFATESDKEKGYTRLYKTGDMVRWLADGNLEFLGRRDSQVKIRGYRIELGEVESVLGSQPGVNQCVVVDLDREQGEKYLVGYVVSAGGSLDVEDLRSGLQKELPDYMVPSVLMELAELPLTINGKLDRKGLPDPVFKGAGYVSPRNELEAQLCKIWEELLGLERVGIEDNFFRLGGNSIIAIKLLGLVRRELGLDMDLSLLFTHKTIGGLSSELVSAQRASIAPKGLSRYALSYAQERLLFIEGYEGGSSAYHIPHLVELSESADVERLFGSINEVANRHKILKTIYVEGGDGVFYQELLEGDLLVERSEFKDKDSLLDAVEKEVHRPFDLSRERSLRLYHYRVEGVDYVLFLFHHISFDGWSVDIFLKDLSLAYAGLGSDGSFRLPLLDISYGDYSVWQRDYLRGDVLETLLSYWRVQLDGYEVLDLPTDYVRPVEIDYSGCNHGLSLDAGLTKGLRALSRDIGTTLNTVLLSGFYVTLHKLTGQMDLLVGSPSDNRHYAETQDMIGFFVNSLVLRLDMAGVLDVEELIVRVHGVVSGAKIHQDLPFEQLVSMLDVERDRSRHPLFQVMFELQSFDHGESLIGSLPFMPVDEGEAQAYSPAKHDLGLFLTETSEEIAGVLNYARSLFKPSTIERIVRMYEDVLRGFVEDRHRSIATIDLLLPSERELLSSWNETDADYPADKTIHELFEEQVEKTPDNVALVYEGEELSYRELNEKSNQLARHIRMKYKEQTGEELKSDTLIGLYVDRSLEMVIGILAVLKAGGAYVPLSPDYPEERVKYMLDDSSSKLLITEEDYVERLQGWLGGSITLLLPGDVSTEVASDNLEVYSGPEDLAYVIYTSGTTGRPKGVMIEHRSVINLLSDVHERYGLKDQEVILQFANYVFDASVEQIFMALVNGHSLHLLSKNSWNEVDSIVTYFEREGITYVELTPSVVENLDLGRLKALKCLNVGGEALNEGLLKRLKEIEGLTIINSYGPTETTCSSVVNVNGNDTSIGHPIQNTKAYVLDNNQSPVPVGVVGELYIGGAGLARGYLNNAELTSERFIANPFATESDKEKGYTRLYKTGDMVRWSADGNMEFLGRRDSQVKVRGYRIELGEIEYALSSIQGIKQSCVLVLERETNSGMNRNLVGYYVADGTVDLLKEDIKRQLSDVLPDYMVPMSLMELEQMPLTTNGKLDRKGLPDPELNSERYVAPITEREVTLCNIWAEVLGLKEVGVTDDFFRIGGDSILSIQVTNRLRQAGFTCQVQDIFLCKNILRLSQLLSENDSSITILSEQGILTGKVGFLPIQRWFTEKVESGDLPSPNHWNQSVLIKVPVLEEAKLVSVLEQLVAYHDVFRIRYSKEKTGWSQRYEPSIPLPELKRLDVSDYSPEELQEILTDWQSGFDLEEGPLFQAGYLYGYSDGSARIYMALHHLIVDGVSWRILSEDIKVLYNEEALPQKGSSYRQWVDAIRDYPNNHWSETDYWSAQLSGYSSEGLSKGKKIPAQTTSKLDKKLTNLLLHDIADAYHTEINDLLLSALAYSLQEINGGSNHWIALEGHGREPIDKNIDHSRTVGWYTSVFPVKLVLQADIGESIKSIKEDLRKIPNKGVGFGAFACDVRTDYDLNDLPRISFNYFGQIEGSYGDWQVVSETSGKNVVSQDNNPDLISINGIVSDGHLVFNIETLLGEEKTVQLSMLFKAHLTSVINHCLKKLELEGAGHTPSDFPLVRLSQDLLDVLDETARESNNSITGIYPANSLQRGFIYHSLGQKDDDAYRVQYVFDFYQELNVSSYIKAWEACIAEYPTLRTSFNWEEELIQIIYKEGSLDYQYHDLSDLKDKQEKDATVSHIQSSDREKGFDLSSSNLLRLHIIKYSSEHYKVIMTVHHSIVDGWSGPNLFESLHSYYDNLISGQKPTVVEDRTYFEAQEYMIGRQQSMTKYWDQALEMVEQANDINAILSRPIDLETYRRVNHPSKCKLDVSGDVYHRLKSFSRKEGITMNVIVQFLWHKLLQIYSNSTLSIVGTTVSGRDLPIPGIEESVGLYINTLPLVIDWDNQLTIVGQMQAIQERVTSMNSHSFADLSSLQKEGKRLFHSLAIFENYPLPTEGGSHLLDISLHGVIENLDYPLCLLVNEGLDKLTIALKYDGDHLTEVDAGHHLATLERILEQVLGNPDQLHTQLSLLNPTEYNQTVCGWNETEADYPVDKTIHELFEEQVEKTPDNVALVYEGEELSYRELNEKSNQLARHIRMKYKEQTGEELKSDTLIGLYVDRSMEMVIGIMAVLKAGGAYVPLSPDYPEERIKYIISETGAQLLLSQKFLGLSSSVNLSDTAIINIDLSEELYLKEKRSNIGSFSKPSDLAYVIYTSGTTGKPKGVMVDHSGIVNRIEWMQSTYPLNAEDVVLHKTPYIFDVSVWELLWANWYGARIVLAKPGGHKDGAYLYGLIEEACVTILHFVPSMLSAYNHFLAEGELEFNHSIRHLFCSGEVLSEQVVADTFSKSTASLMLHNLYGPTEASVDVTYYHVERNKKILIGRPIQNTKAYVLDSNNAPVPVGAPGELYIGGAGLARGYLNNAELTSERFIANPFATEEDREKGYTRLYKTGDMVRWLADGNLEFLGRRDSQVKIRGYRIELGEVESVLGSQPGVNQCVVVDLDREDGEKYLVGYVVSAGGSLDVEDLRSGLQKELPDYMVPSVLMELAELPLTINGKLDRKGLPDPVFKGAGYVSPRNELEAQLCKIWEELLGLERVGIEDNFFRLGGNSIIAIKLLGLVRRELGLDMDLSLLFTHKTIGGLSSELVSAQRASIAPKGLSRYALSHAQERLLFIEGYEGGSSAYHIPYLVELSESADVDRLFGSINEVANRHKILKTIYVEGGDGVFYQELLEGDLLVERSEFKDKDSLLDAVEKEVHRPFDLSRERSLRLYHYRVEGVDYVLFLFHHISFDGWSVDIFLKDLSLAYAGLGSDGSFRLPLLDISYGDYSVWQRDYLRGDVLETLLSYWRVQLDGYEVLDLPTDYVRPVEIDYSGCNHGLSLDAGLTKGLRALSRDIGTTLNTVLLSGFYVTLHKLTGQMDLLVGSPSDNRHYAETQDMIGFFVNSLVLRLDMAGVLDVEELIGRVHEVVSGAKIHQDLPFEQLVSMLDVERDRSRHPLFQVMFELQSFDHGESLIGSLPFMPVDEGEAQAYSPAKHDLGLFLTETSEEIAGVLNYARSLFKPSTIERIVRMYEDVLRGFVEDRNRSIATIDLLLPSERELLSSWNETDADYPADKTIHELFEEQVEKTPDNVALVYEGEELSYRELNEKSNQLARHIRMKYKEQTGEELKSDTLIGLYVDRSMEMVIGILAVLKAGGAYVPLSPDYPEERIKYMLDDSSSKLLITEEDYVERLQGWLGGSITLLLPGDVSTEMASDNLEGYSGPEDLAYVIYTSGTTGKPKGVMIEQKGVINLINDIHERFELKDQEVILQFANYVFDASVEQIFLTLLNGHSLHLFSKNKQIDSIVTYIEREEITYAELTPSAAENVNLKRLKTLKYFNLGGEALNEGLLKRLKEIEGLTIINSYGPTETTCSSVVNVNGNDTSIGHPIQNTKAYVLDSNNAPVPVGAPGELHIGGAGLARGYLNNAELTSERFIANPFATESDREKGYTRLYKTGDMVRWLADGNLEFLGRRDSQVKIRGYRIELGEVESVLGSQPGVNQCVVVDLDREQGEKYLVGYVVSAGGSLDVEDLRLGLQKELPDYMVPSVLMELAELPLTINGKLDRKGLPDPVFKGAEYVSPRNELEAQLCKIWEELLGLERVGIEDNFFRLGGNSIIAIKLLGLVRRELGLDMDLSLLFTHKTIGGLSSELVSAQRASIAPKGLSRYALSYAQERLLFIEGYEGGSSAYHIPHLVELSESADVERLFGSINEVANRHKILKTIYVEGGDGVFYQELLEGDLLVERSEFKDKDSLLDAVEKEVHRPFDLSRERSLRLYHYRVEGVDYVLFLFHHISFDGWSVDIFLKDLSLAYAGLGSDGSFRLPLLDISYGDYSVWQRDYLRGDVLETLLSYWRVQLDGYEVLDLPTDYVRPVEIDYSGCNHGLSLDAGLTKGLRALSRDIGTTLNTVLLSGFYVTLHKLTGQMDLLVGSPSDNRHYAETQDMIGFFVNSLVLRLDMAGVLDVEELIGRVHEVVSGAKIHQDLPFEQLVSMLDVERDRSRHPLFQVMFELQSFDHGESLIGSLPFMPVDEGEAQAYSPAKHDLGLFLTETSEEIAGVLNYARSLFKPSTIERIVRMYEDVLRGFVEDRHRSIATIDLLLPSERELLSSWNETDADYPADKTIHELFEEQVEKTPDNVALVYEGEELSYRELNEKSNQLARHIRMKYKEQTGEELKSDTLIGLYVDRSLEMVIGILAVLKAGGAYVPLSPDYPEERVKYMLDDSSLKLLITEEDYVERLQGWLGGSVTLLLPGDVSTEMVSDNLEVYSGPEDLAYVIYTSGTTGKPKGVMIEHRSVVSLICSDHFSEVTNDDVFLHHSNPSFDAATFELWGALLNGSKLVVSRGDISSSEGLKRILLDQGITVLWMTRSLFDTIYLHKKDLFQSLNYLLVGGESLTPAIIRELSTGESSPSHLLNGYGPTEGTTFTTTFDCDNVYDSSVPIGNPINTRKAYVLDSNNAPVPVGAPGELHIGGAGLARGYLNNAELTSERFITNPFATESDREKGYTRLYKTGDMVRWLADGNLEFLGRRDSQVKIRGYRIELEEIEYALLTIPEIEQSCVLARAREVEVGIERYLVGYYITNDEENNLSENYLRDRLLGVLPEYMVPDFFVSMESFPLTTNGKLNKRSLPEPDLEKLVENYEAPKTETEIAICKIWEKALGINKVGLTDDFFRIGGNSISAISVATQMSKTLSNHVSVSDLFKHSTIKKILSKGIPKPMNYVEGEL